MPKISGHLIYLAHMRKILFPIRDAFLTALLGLGFSEGQAQNGCNGERYRYTSAFPEIEVSYDHVYGGNINALGLQQDLVFDLYTPADDIAVDRALVVVAHGGFFLAGSNDGADVVSICEDLAHMGYVVASISYRLGVDDLLGLQTSMIEAVWRGVHDARAAVRFFRKSVVEADNPYGIDPERIAVWGSSAGGHLVSMLGVSGEVEVLEGKLGKHLGQSSRVQAVVNYYGPSALLLMNSKPSRIDHDAKESPESQLIGAPIQTVKAKTRQASPLMHVTPDDAPHLHVHGTDDPLVPFHQSQIYHAALKKAGVESTLITVQAGGHSAPRPVDAGQVRTFLERHLYGRGKPLPDETVPVK